MQEAYVEKLRIAEERRQAELKGIKPEETSKERAIRVTGMDDEDEATKNLGKIHEPVKEE